MNSELILAATLRLPDNPVASPAVRAQVKRLNQKVPKAGIADRGYRGKSKVNDTKIMIPKPPRKNASKEALALARKRFRRRAGIEPIIGHLKSDHRLKRNFLRGFEGDQINLLMAAAAFNFRKWMRMAIFWLKNLHALLHQLFSCGCLLLTHTA